jgi:hypothetical protein
MLCSKDMATASTREHKPQGNEPLTTAEYLNPCYWDERFEKEEQYDWFKDLSQFRHLLLPNLRPSDRILVLGCGNSAMTMDLWREGFKNICSIDLSEVCLSPKKFPVDESRPPRLTAPSIQFAAREYPQSCCLYEIECNS